MAAEIVDRLGQHERYVLTEATVEELVRVARPEIAGAIVAQRTGAISRSGERGSNPLEQGAFDF